MARRPRRPRAPHKESPPPTGPPCTLRLDRFASGGDAVATRDDGKTVFVEDGVPGDLVRARIVDERKRFARARIEEVLEPSADRVSPRCPHFGRCGGCAWQHVRYEAQVEAKATILRDALERIGRFKLDAAPAFIPSPEPYGHRGRARVHVSGGRVGFLERTSHRLCAIDACPVMQPALEKAVLALADGCADGEWSVCIGTSDDVSVAAATAAPGAEASSPRAVELEVAGARIGLDARAFSQANRALHEKLIERVGAVLFHGVSSDARRAWHLLEVHAGVGFFTHALCGEVGRVTAVESDPHAATWLARNVADRPVEVVEGTFAEAAERLAQTRFDAVLLDPPRSGLAPAEVDALVGLAPARIVYLSCDPATLARDARRLADEAGYTLEHVEGFDLFPQTPHTEGLIRLELG